MELAHEKFPGIYKACFAVTLDNGGLNRDRSEEQIKEEFDAWILGVEENESWNLEKIDKWLSGLSDADMETVTAGEHTEMQEILQDAPGFTDDLLTAWFEGPC